MSPASSGALEVERYIGACLITSQNRSKGNSKLNIREPLTHREDFVPRYLNNHQLSQRCRTVDGWAGGIPLISFANYQRRGNKTPHYTRVHDHYPISHLAVHTHGAPLILTNKNNYRRNKATIVDKHIVKSRNFSANCKTKDNNSQGADTVSVNSDESSASTNSENCLPRIIKPRKRRKKDRKPTHLISPLGNEDCFSTDSASPDIDSYETSNLISGAIPFSFVPHVPVNNDLNEYNTIRFQRDVQEAPKLHHAFEDIEDISKDLNDNQQTSSCQCRYCDPSGQIWDIERHCYSPFLTTPNHQSTFNFPDIQENSFKRDCDFLTVSSLSECMKSICLSENWTERNYFPASRDLEVSTEIVTSLNGHRDLEIKFYTTPNSEKSKNNIETLHFNECGIKSDSLDYVNNNDNNNLIALDLNE